MIRKVINWLILLVIAAVVVLFAVANRQRVTVNLDPLGMTSPPLTASPRAWIVALALVIVGVIVGGSAGWLRQARWRRTARALDADVRILHQELEVVRRRADAQDVRREQAQESRALTLSSAGR